MSGFKSPSVHHNIRSNKTVKAIKNGFKNVQLNIPNRHYQSWFDQCRVTRERGTCLFKIKCLPVMIHVTLEVVCIFFTLDLLAFCHFCFQRCYYFYLRKNHPAIPKKEHNIKYWFLIECIFVVIQVHDRIGINSIQNSNWSQRHFNTCVHKPFTYIFIYSLIYFLNSV